MVLLKGKRVIKLWFGQHNLYLKDAMGSSKLRGKKYSGPIFDKIGMIFTGKIGKMKIFRWIYSDIQ